MAEDFREVAGNLARRFFSLGWQRRISRAMRLNRIEVNSMAPQLTEAREACILRPVKS